MNTSKNILIVTPEIPFPVFKGNQNRIDQTIRLLSSLGHKVSIAALNSNQRERQSQDIERELTQVYCNVNDVIVRRHEKFSHRKYSRLISFLDRKFVGPSRICTQATCPNNFRKVVKKYINKNNPDVVIVNYLKIADVIPSRYKGLTIIDTHDFATNILRQGLLLKPNQNINVDKFEASERKWMRKFDVAIAINPREQSEFKQKFEVEKCYTIPSFHKVDNVSVENEDHEYDILFVGSSSPFNIEGFLKFNAKSIPMLRRLLGREPQVAIVGDVCNAAAIKKLSGSYLHKLGRVDDLSIIYKKSKVVVCPLLSGAGMKIKVVEALSHAKAIVTTSVGADGINIIDKYHAYVSDGWDVFSNSIRDIIVNDRIRKELELNARALALSEYSYDAVSDKWKYLISTGEIPEVDFSKKSNEQLKKETPSVDTYSSPLKRKKCLIFGMDARTLMDFNLDIAIRMKELGVYSEILKMEAEHKNHFMQRGFITHSMRQLITKRHRDTAIKWYDLNKSTLLPDLFYKNVHIGIDIQIHKEMFPQHFHGEKYAKSIIHAVVLIEALLELSKKITPDFFIGWNGNGPHMMYVPKIVAAILNKPILFVERGLLPDSYVIDSQGVNFKSHCAGSYIPLLTKERLNKADKYIEEFGSSNNSIVNTGQEILKSKHDIIERLKLKEKGYIFFPEQIEADSNIIINSPKFKSMSAVANELLVAAETLGLSLVVRQHPENKSNDIKYSDNVVVCNDIHIHSLLRYSEFNVTINSTTGLESLLLRKPTFVLGNSIYSGKGFTFDVRSADEIIEKYNQYNSDKNVLSVANHLFSAFLSFLITDYLIFTKESKLNNSSKIINSILDRIGLGERLRTIPAPTKACANYVLNYFSLNKAIEEGKRFVIINAVREDTKLYFTGPNRPLFDISKIENMINREQISEIVSCKIGYVFDIVDSLVSDHEKNIIVIVNNGATRIDEIKKRYSSRRLFVIDEYFSHQ